MFPKIPMLVSDLSQSVDLRGQGLSRLKVKSQSGLLPSMHAIFMLLQLSRFSRVQLCATS